MRRTFFIIISIVVIVMRKTKYFCHGGWRAASVAKWHFRMPFLESQILVISWLFDILYSN